MADTPQGGAIAWRLVHQRVQVLVVRSKKSPDKWVFPKGHLEPGESESQAALRELGEEAGVTGVLGDPVGPPARFQSGDEAVAVQYYAVRATGTCVPAERRETAWVDPWTARTLLSYEGARQLLDQLMAGLEQSAGAAPAPDGDAFRDFLLAELSHLTDSFLRNEEDGERRVTFFITLVGAIGGAMAFAAGDSSAFDETVRPLVAVTLGLLLLLGLMTLKRVVSRNVTADEYKQRLVRARTWFHRDLTDAQREAVPFPSSYKPRPPRGWLDWGRGGWQETVRMVNAVMFAATVVVAFEELDNWSERFGVGLGALLIAWIVLWKVESLWRSQQEAQAHAPAVPDPQRPAPMDKPR